MPGDSGQLWVNVGTIMIEEGTRTRRVMKLCKDIEMPCNVVANLPVTPMTCAGCYFFDLIFKYSLVGFNFEHHYSVVV